MNFFSISRIQPYQTIITISTVTLSEQFSPCKVQYRQTKHPNAINKIIKAKKKQKIKETNKRICLNYCKYYIYKVNCWNKKSISIFIRKQFFLYGPF